MKAWGNALGCGLVATAILLVGDRAARGHQPVATEPAKPAPTARPPVPPERIEALVRELGSDQFAVREKATRELIALGIVTREALKRAMLEADAEVRTRAREILGQVCELDFQNRLEAFSADYDGSHKQTLPGWGQFSAQYGAGRVARQLFVEMQRAEPALLASLDEGSKAAAEALNERVHDILNGDGEGLSNLGTKASLLFVGAAAGVEVDRLGSTNLYPYLVQSIYQGYAKSPLWPGLLRKIVGRWITKDDTPGTASQNLIFAVQLELKEEALLVATRVVTSVDAAAGSKQMAILIVGRYGNHSHLAILEKLLADATACDPAPTENVPQPIELQIRDVALAVLLHLTDQDLREYGFPSAQPFGQNVFQSSTLTFANPAAREAALKKWAAWRADHPA